MYNIEYTIHKIWMLLDQEKQITIEKDGKILNYEIRKITEKIKFETQRLERLLNQYFQQYLPNKMLIFRKKIKVQLVASTIVIILPHANHVLQSDEEYYNHVNYPLVRFLRTLDVDIRASNEGDMIIEFKRHNSI